MESADTRTVEELFDLSGCVAVVTGGPGRLGSQICETLAELGAHVVVVSRTLEDCERTAEDLSSETTASAIQADVTDENAVERMVETVLDQQGSLDVFVNNAYSGTAASFEEMTVEQWRSALDGAMTSTFLCTQAAAEPMKLQESGAILNIGSIYGVVAPDQSIYGRAGNNNPPNYGPAKAGVIQFTRWAATYLAEWDIRVNCLSPGGFYNDDRATEDRYYDVDFVPNYQDRTPLGRMGNETDLKGPVALLTSDAGKWMTGQNVLVDGGWTVW